VAVRQMFSHLIPEMNEAVRLALKATRYEGVTTCFLDKDSGDMQTVESQVERPDHGIRLQALDAVRGILAVVQPRDPAVQITSTTVSNTQNNLLTGGHGGATDGLTSPEAMIREIQARRGYALGDGSQSAGAGSQVVAGPAATAAHPVVEAQVEARSVLDEDDEEEYDEDAEEEEDDDEEEEED